MRLLHFIASTVLMTAVLLSSTGLRISQHWCGDRLVGTSIFGEAQACSHYQSSDKPACPMHANTGTKKNCCDQRETIIDGNDYEFESLEMEPLRVPKQLIAILMTDWGISFSEIAAISVKYHNHSPPLLASEIFIQIQSFLL